jgi:hypothetical protein
MLKIDIKKNLDFTTTIPCPACKKEIPITNKEGETLHPSQCPQCKTPIKWK